MKSQEIVYRERLKSELLTLEYQINNLQPYFTRKVIRSWFARQDEVMRLLKHCRTDEQIQKGCKRVNYSNSSKIKEYTGPRVIPGFIKKDYNPNAPIVEQSPGPGKFQVRENSRIEKVDTTQWLCLDFKSTQMKKKKTQIIILEAQGYGWKKAGKKTSILIRVVLASEFPPEYAEIQVNGRTIYKAKTQKKVRATAAIWDSV